MINVTHGEFFDLGRGLPSNRQVFTFNSNEYLLDTNNIYEQLKVSHIVRIQAEDFPRNLQKGDEYVHFNLHIEPDRNFQGDRALIIAIQKQGLIERSHAYEVKPLLNLSNAWIAEFIYVNTELSYEEVTSNFFEGKVIGNVKDAEELRNVIFDRYKNVLVELTEDQIKAKKISIRVIKFVRPLTEAEIIDLTKTIDLAG